MDLHEKPFGPLHKDERYLWDENTNKWIIEEHAPSRVFEMLTVAMRSEGCLFRVLQMRSAYQQNIDNMNLIKHNPRNPLPKAFMWGKTREPHWDLLPKVHLKPTGWDKVSYNLKPS